MLGNWNYENYTKAIVPLVLAGASLLVGWVDAGELNRAELGNVIWLGAAALLVFIAPNVKMAKGSEVVEGDPNRSQNILRERSRKSAQEREAGQPNAVPQVRVPRPLAEEVTKEEEKPTTTRRRRTPPKE